MDEQGHDNELGQDNDGAAIPTSDAIPGEMVISYDKNNPSMDLGTVYPNNGGVQDGSAAIYHQ